MCEAEILRDTILQTQDRTLNWKAEDPSSSTSSTTTYLGVYGDSKMSVQFLILLLSKDGTNSLLLKYWPELVTCF